MLCLTWCHPVRRRKGQRRTSRDAPWLAQPEFRRAAKSFGALAAAAMAIAATQRGWRDFRMAQ